MKSIIDLNPNRLFMNIRVFICILVIFSFFSCEKNIGPSEPIPGFELFVNNTFNELQGRFAVFVSDQNTGEIRTFRWVPGEDTIHLQVPNSKATDRFDCTVFKVTTITAPGTGVRDTFLTLTTYTDLSSSEQINLRDLVFQQTSSLTFNLTGMNTLDSVVVSDAYTISRPQASNNFRGEYFCYHSGMCWLRILVNGDPFWRFVRFDNVNSTSIEANTLDAQIFLSILAPPLKLNFPFFSAWEYKVDGLVDSTTLAFFPLSAPLRAPGSYVPIVNGVNIFEPVNNDVFNPNRPYDGLRIQTRGTESAIDGYTYLSDHFYSTMPASLPVPDFNLEPTILADKRLIAVQCLGDFDLLAFSRERSDPHQHLTISWQVITKPKSGIVSYRLPDVPSVLGDQYIPLKMYDFNAGVRARAESYEAVLSYENIVRNHLRASDVLWQAKAGYLGREEQF